MCQAITLASDDQSLQLLGRPQLGHIELNDYMDRIQPKNLYGDV